MRIAQVAPLFESVPPQYYGGIERVTSYLTEELVDLGHRVTLFASGDSVTRAELVAGCAKALRLNQAQVVARDRALSSQKRVSSVTPLSGKRVSGVRVSEMRVSGIPPEAPSALPTGPAIANAELDLAHSAMLNEVYERRQEFDIIHFQLGDWHLREPRLLKCSHVTTVHERMDSPESQAVFDFPALRLIAVSDAQKRPAPFPNWLGTVYHGLPDGLYRPHYQHGKHLTFLGRLAPETRVDRAVEIARRFGMPLKIAAKVSRADYPYYLSVRSLLRESCVEFVGEVNEAQKSELLAGSYALLFPIDWPEPFGLSAIEAMATGTPVIAWRNGAMPELVDHGVTGFVVDSIEGAVSALSGIGQLDRRLVARIAYQRFAARRMARDYLRLYARSIARDLTVPAELAMPAPLSASAELTVFAGSGE